ncbi:MAG: polysaccharide deacetylase family protein [Actinobacteria bacterium]|nr:polysaccharide deacetylase family protein [Actinomycetota bacterium]MBU4402264.1 polysaccharide deacetylase family protein [Actinomycetota bacterium]MBU4443174.1 polysaccharide deacetylase family protein [Actinomycetota bacterium]MCG2817586.1 polysaccharide deacetylase family protein [Actinomycetes bacterium]
MIGSSTGPSKTWYFAEGTTRAGFDEYVCLLNPGSKVSITEFSYMLGTGETLVRRHDLLPASRTTINVRSDVPPESDVSIKVTASEPIVAERPMYFNYKGAWSGGHNVLGATGPKPEWYFAEGTTRDGFDTYLCLQNPGDLEATVDVDYFLVNGTREFRTGVKIKPRSRFTIAAHEDGLGIGRHNDASGDFSARVRTSAQAPIVAERATYFNYRPYLDGGHDVIGASGPREDWYFAEGTTRPGFDTYLCLANPGTRDAKVDIDYFCGDGQDVEREDITVRRGSRLTIATHDDNLGIGRHDDPRGDFSAKVHSANGVPVVAERVTYFNYQPFWSGGHDVVGAAAPALRWYFSEGCTRQGFDTYLCLANPGGKKAIVDVTYFRGDNQTESKSGIEVPPRSRFTIAVHDGNLGIGRHDDAGGDVSMEVKSSNGVPVVAERPMYFAERWRTMYRTAIAGAWGWGDVTHGKTSRPYVALTFDCENNGGSTGQILDILKQKGVHATCFVLDKLPASFPDVVMRMADEGHEIGNHGVTHPHFTRIPPERVTAELGTTEEAVNRITGFTTKPYFRFPYGDRNVGVIAQVNSLGYLSTYWSVDPQEWRASNSAQSVINTVVGQSGPGAIVLMHDVPKTIAALPAIIDGLRARGFMLVTLTELLYPGPVGRP